MKKNRHQVFVHEKNTAILLFSVLALVSCRTGTGEYKQFKLKKINSSLPDLPEDGAINAVIEPYKTQLETKMNTKIRQ